MPDGEPAIFPGVTVAPAPACARWSLRARDPAELERVLGIRLPRRIGETLGGIACLGPDEWLARLAPGSVMPAGAGAAVSVVDISGRALAFVIDGPRAAQLLESGCPRDIARFAPGDTTRTIYEGVEIVMHRDGPHRFVVEVARSFAAWLWTALTTAARDLQG